MDTAIKNIPYGMTDFEAIISDNYYYVDKTQYISLVERTARFFFFVRPRRFGKSLFLGMLGNYYDIYKKDKFEEIFGGLYVGKHPTPNRNKYLVLSFNFSSVAADIEQLKDKFDEYCKQIMIDFAKKYGDLLGVDALEDLKKYNDADLLLGSLCLSARSKEYSASEWIHHDKGSTELKSIALVFKGWSLVRVEEA